MVINPRTTFFIFLALFIIWLLYLDRALLSPFVLAAIFAYIFNPVVNFFSNKLRIPRAMSVFFIYFFLIGIITFFSIYIAKQIINESSEFKVYITHLIEITKNELNTFPDWTRPAIDEALSSLEKTKLFSPQSLFLLFPQAISRIVSFFLFLFSGFYFLKDGKKIFDKLILFVHASHKIEVEILVQKINNVLGGYLRGQLLLVFIVSLMLYVTLSVLNVKFALILAVFSGFAEIIPFIGPITAGAVAVVVVLITNSSSFSLTPIQLAAVVAIAYFLIRHFQDYFINPHVMGRITKLHPLIILFAVLSGGHLWGILGYLISVPVAASLKILLEFFIDKINLSLEENKPDSV